MTPRAPPRRSGQFSSSGSVASIPQGGPGAEVYRAGKEGARAPRWGGIGANILTAADAPLPRVRRGNALAAPRTAHRPHIAAISATAEETVAAIGLQS